MGLKSFFVKLGIVTDGNVTASKTISDWSGENALHTKIDNILYEGAIEGWHFGAQDSATVLASYAVKGRILPRFMPVGQLPIITTIPVGCGYGPGAGSVVTQITSRTTGVTINTPAMQIALFSAAGSPTPVSFDVTNSIVNQTDTFDWALNSGANVYQLMFKTTGTGFRVFVWSVSGTTVEAPIFNITVKKGSST